MEQVKPWVSVVVPAYQCAKTIGKTLDALSRQTYCGPMDVVVVDDGSTDETAQVIQSFSSVKYVYQSNAGPASARNRGAFLSTGKFILFTDSDCIPAPDWVERLIFGFHKEKIAAVAGSYDIANPQSLLAKAIHQEILFRHKKLMPIFPKAFGSYNVAIRREIFKELNGFTASYRYPSGEDNDLSYKIIEAGFQIFFEPQACVQHFFPTRMNVYLKEQFRHGFWRVKLYQSHPKMLKGDDYTFWKDIAEPALVMFFLFGMIISFVNVLFSKWIMGLSAFFLCVLEIFYGLLIMEQGHGGLFFAFVMVLRSWARTLGFLTGFFFFFPHFFPKKNQ